MDKVLVTVIPRTLREGEREILGMEGGKVAVSFFPFCLQKWQSKFARPRSRTSSGLRPKSQGLHLVRPWCHVFDSLASL